MLARSADVVYSTGMIGRSSLGAAVAGTPIVLKLTSDPAFERSLRWRLTGPDLDAFQSERGLAIGAIRRARDLALARAALVLVPSAAFRQLALAWGVPPDKTELLPNPVAPPRDLDAPEELRRRLGLEGPTVVYAGRLVPQKSLDVALEAVRQTDGISLVVAGDGPERARLESRRRELGLDGRARFLGSQSRRRVFELLHAADVAVLSSSWENFPHMALEALAVGTPVVATDVGGVREILRDGWNGLLVPAGDAGALAAALARYFGDEALREQLRRRAVESVAEFSPEAIYGRLQQLLARAATQA
jgi:glycosyltransferase involved in cell wall biosynthesis